MKNFGKTVAATAGLLGLLAGAPAVAGPVLQAAPCNSTIDLGSSGTVTYSQLTAGVCVLVVDKLFGGFSFTGGTGSFVPTQTVAFTTLITGGGLLLHQISFNNNYVNGLTYDLGFEVAVTDPKLQIISLSGDFTQADGTGVNSELKKNSNPTGTPSSGIDIFKTGILVQPGSVGTILYPGGQTDLIISETLTASSTAAISSITNVIIENGIPTRVPEPASLALLGIGLSALGFSRRRKQS